MSDKYFQNLSKINKNQNTLRTINILNGYLQKTEFYESTCLLPYNKSKVVIIPKKLK